MKTFHTWVIALALLAAPCAPLAQTTQPIPTAVGIGGAPKDVVATSILIAPAGGGAGKGTPLSYDKGLPIQGRDTVSNLPCAIGATSTCQLPGSGGGGGGSLSATASAAPTPVTAGANKPLNIGLFSNLFATVIDPSGNPVDFSAPVPLQPFTPTGVTTKITAGSGSSVSAAMSAAGPAVQIYNSGTNPAWVAFGTGSATAAVGTSYYVPAGQTLTFTSGTATWWAAYGVGGTSDLYLTPGAGQPSGWGGGGGGGGGGAITSVDLGVVGDSAWSGSGSGTLIAIEKYAAAKDEAVRALLAGTLTVSGTVTANAGSGTMAVSAASLPLPSGAMQQTGGTVGIVAGTATGEDVGSATFGGPGTSCTTMTLPGTGGTYSGPASSIVNGDNVANNATAGSITNQTCALPRYAAGPFTLTGVRLLTSNTTITNGTFRVHFYTTAPTFTNGNDGVYLTPHAGHVCSMDVTLGPASGGQVFSDGADGFGVPVAGPSCSRVLASGTTVYWTLEARAAYVWVAGQTFNLFPQGFN